jgi:hypothetical protein
VKERERRETDERHTPDARPPCLRTLRLRNAAVAATSLLLLLLLLRRGGGATAATGDDVLARRVVVRVPLVGLINYYKEPLLNI